MADLNRCPCCGAEPPALATEGLCPACLMRNVLEGDTGETDGPAAAFPSTQAGADTASADAPTRARGDSDAPTVDGSGRDSEPSLPRGTAVRYFGDYEILGELGRGGMGVVYRARQVSLNRPVALKMVKAGLLAGDDELRRFQNEAEAVALLDHPGIVPVYEVGEHDGQHYFSMKLVEGGSLVPLLSRYKNDPKACARQVAEAAEAVAHAHMRGILHRDLKPANLLVDAEGHPHVTDFGLAKRVEADVEFTQSGAILGTPAYMSPEQAQGRRGSITMATDVYGLGAVLYALLTGKAPFGGDSVAETLDAVRNAPPEPPKKLNARVPRDLETITLKCLEKGPRRRYATAQALADDLKAWLENRPIVARRVGSAERAWLWCKRRPAVAALAAAVAVATVGGSAATIAVQRAANVRLDRKNTELTDALGREAAANSELRRANERVKQRYDLAVDAIQRFHTSVSEDFLLKQDQFKELRDRLLNSAQEFYQRLSAMLGKETDTASRRPLAQSNFELAEIIAQVGRRVDALAAHRAVLAIRESLPSEPDSSSSTKADVARSLVSIAGLLEATGDTQEALGKYRHAVQMLTEQSPSDPLIRAGLADCRSRMAWLLLKMGATAEALKTYQLARADQDSLVDTPRARIQSRRDLAGTLHGIGVLLSEMGDPTAEDALRSALEIRQELSQSEPKAAGPLFALGGTHCALGELLGRAGRTESAQTEYRVAIRIGEDLQRRYPGITDFVFHLAYSHSGLGFVLERVGQVADACAEHRSAIHLYQRLVDDNPEVTDFRARLAVSRATLGYLLSRTGKTDAAMTEYRQASAEIQRLVDANPDIIDYQARLAGLHANLGSLLLQTGRPEDSFKEFGAAVTLLQRLADKNHDVIAFRGRLAMNHVNLGFSLANTRDFDLAEAEYRTATSLFQQLVQAHPTVVEFKHGLALANHDLGMLLAYEKRFAEAESAYQAALKLRQSLAAELTNDPESWSRLADSHSVIGDLLIKKGRANAAEDSYREALKIREKLNENDPAVRQYRRDLAHSLALVGRIEQRAGRSSIARKSFEKAVTLMEGLEKPTKEESYDQACYQALAASAAGDSPGPQRAEKQQREADLAIRFLLRAVGLGFREVAHMRADTDLDSLRSRDDFQHLMMDLSLPTEPFTR